MQETPLRNGIAVIEAYVRTLPEGPGVYRMVSAKGDLLYVGKAKSLKKRVASYTQPERLPLRLQRMVAATHTMVFVETATEIEALLLEANLIKKLRPYYNVLLKDDKMFPSILLRTDHEYPQILKHRGVRKTKGHYFGPFASSVDVNRTLIDLQRAFLLRNCPDSIFSTRKRPCLQYHIKRCTAPCVAKVSQQHYASQVQQAKDFLSGKNAQVQKEFAADMHKASEAQDYEQAAKLRDRIKALTSIQSYQRINVSALNDADVIAIARMDGLSCVNIFFFRNGQNFGNRPHFIRHDPQEDTGEILGACMAQFYADKEIPPLILVSDAPQDQNLLMEAFASKTGHKVTITTPKRGTKYDIISFARTNAERELSRYQTARIADANLLQELKEIFNITPNLERIEVYDNSHLAGTKMVGGMIVSGPEGFIKKAYRKFNARHTKAGDDFGMMREVMMRRFQAWAKEGSDKEVDEDSLPDLMLIDGGAGQLSAVLEILKNLGLDQRICVVAIAKGPDRHAGREWFYLQGSDPFQLPAGHAVLHYLQRLRDEAHRYVIGAQRVRRMQDLDRSHLDEVPGIGAVRKKALLAYFGSAKAVADASLEDIQKVQGISKDLADKIHAYFKQSV